MGGIFVKSKHGMVKLDTKQLELQQKVEKQAKKNEQDRIRREIEYQLATEARHREMARQMALDKRTLEVERAETKQRVISEMNTLYNQHLRKKQII